ncbi:MAG: N-6 DNA methylase [Candidatus Eremiobacteraeota bacterium]|nr:N-6 DNA methylase [Candidatus Eremiobacteraeota bacterium]
MARLQRNIFTTIRTEGAILPVDVLARISRNDPDIKGLKPEDYHLAEREKINEAINRSWNRLVSVWKSFSNDREKLPDGVMGTTITRERWLLILFQELGYGRLLTSKAIDINEKSYPISHMWNNAPIHLVGFRVNLDRRTKGVAGASRTSPHSLVQEFLNRSEEHLWGFVSNGLTFRILRDNISLTRQAYVEFDLESMMDGEIYSDFVLLWLLCHQSRVESEKPHECWLEKWSRFAKDKGVRALEGLRKGVEKAISFLGEGFFSFERNRELKDKLKTGTLSTQDYYRQLLRLVYRLIFLYVAEDRGLLLISDVDDRSKKMYMKYYSTGRIRNMASRIRGTRHFNLYRGLRLVMDKLSSDEGCLELALPTLGSFLWSENAIPDITQCDISNNCFLDAVRSLAYIQEGRVRRIVDYKNLGAEELGSVYESLLELHPNINVDAGTFSLGTAGGHERKTTGSYYTPTSLITCLLDSALDPVLEEAVKRANKIPPVRGGIKGGVNPAETAILNLKVCDPACGSGHFLVAAAHRMAKHLASVRTGDEEPSPEETRHALRDVIGRCIYGVDINPMSVELCKVSLWMEAMEPGKPLSFLDHHIKCGNSLIGTTPVLIENGIPDDAFKPIIGDDKKFCREYKSQNKKERETYGKDYEGQLEMFGRGKDFKPWEHLGNFASAMMKLDDIDDSSIKGVHRKEERYEKLVKSTGYIFGKLLADAWCAAFMWKKKETDDLPYPITEDIFRRIERNPHSCPKWMKEEIKKLSDQYQFFHWHLEFPDVFRPDVSNPDTSNNGNVAQGFSLDVTQPKTSNNVNVAQGFSPAVTHPESVIARSKATKQSHNNPTGWNGGFDVVLGNPPWERIKLQEKEWFANRRLDIAAARNASVRKKMIQALAWEDPALYKDFQDHKRKSEGDSHFVRNSERYPLCGRGDINTYTIFAELNRSMINAMGKVGCIVPSGIATDDTTKYFFQDLMNKKSLVSLYDFENRKGIFVGVHRSYKFCLLTLTGTDHPNDGGTEFIYYAIDTHDLMDKRRVFSLLAKDVELINPNTKTCPIFRSKRDAELIKSIYKKFPVLIRDEYPKENLWRISFRRIFDMNKREVVGKCKQIFEDACIKMYEAKLLHQFNHRWGTYQETKVVGISKNQLIDPLFEIEPRYWIDRYEVDLRLERLYMKKWIFGYRDISNVTNERTLLATLIPYSGTDFSIRVIVGIDKHKAICLLSNLNSFMLDYIVRQMMGGLHLSDYIIKQVAIIPPNYYNKNIEWLICGSLYKWLFYRVLELIYTSWDLKVFSDDLDFSGPPFKWNEQRRFLIRCELDAAYFHLYEINREDLDYIMETFPIVKRKDEKKYDSFYANIPFVKECCEKYQNPEKGEVSNGDAIKHGESPDEVGTKYATKAVILEIYNRMKKAMETDIPYQTVLNPPPSDPSVAHSKKGVEIDHT